MKRARQSSESETGEDEIPTGSRTTSNTTVVDSTPNDSEIPRPNNLRRTSSEEELTSISENANPNVQNPPPILLETLLRDPPSPRVPRGADRMEERRRRFGMSISNYVYRPYASTSGGSVFQPRSLNDRHLSHQEREKRRLNLMEKNTFVLLKGDETDDDVTCVICLSLITKLELIRKLPCRHFFHKDCIDEWLKIRELCPTCRQDMECLLQSTPPALS